ncbi:protein trunk [Neodiprion lecontei]|uniref:Protein trunk n=1 Tax=Neodiprion lecontei TaxID=441921 RepID=A0ABM3GF24_NEOLC|nr:protein trunk [Neodiprion lecontei]
MGFRVEIVLAPLLCLHHTRFAVFGAPIKRDRIQVSNDRRSADFGPSADPTDPEHCRTIPEIVLRTVLGSAFNARYMSIIDPREISVRSEPIVSEVVKRRINEIPSFFVDEEYNFAFSNDPAWELEFSNMKYERESPTGNANTEENASEGEKRKVRHAQKSTPWQCDSKIE